MKNIIFLLLGLMPFQAQSVVNLELFSAVGRLSDATIAAGRYVLGKISPDYQKRRMAKEQELRLALLLTEDSFLDCLVMNAKKPVNADGIPSECQECFKSFVSFGGETKIDGIIQEFKEAVKRIPEESSRNTAKKIIIGTVIGVTAAGVIIVAAPVVFPGTIVAAKATAIAANAKAAGGIILVKTGKVATTAATTLYQAAQAAPDKAMEVVNVSKDVAIQLFVDFKALPITGQIIQAAEIAEKVNKVFSFYSALQQPMRDKLENDLFANYHKKGSLTERIKKTYNIK